jgi:hypothetical protein
MTDSDDKRDFKDGLQYDPTSGGYQAVDSVSQRRLRNIQIPGAQYGADRDRSPSGKLAPPRAPRDDETVDLTKISADLRCPPQPAGPLNILDPEAAIRILTQAHEGFFAKDLDASGQSFIKLRYHVGTRGQAWEFYSSSYPVAEDSWAEIREQLAEHFRESFGELEPEVVEKVKVRVIFFHEPTVYAQKSTDPEVCRAPLDFATAFYLTVGEFDRYLETGQVPSEFRLRFDASYLWLGPDTLEPFVYTRQWRFFAGLLYSFSDLIERPMLRSDLPIRILEEHIADDLPNLVTSIGMTDKKTYQSQERVYRPSFEIVFSQDRTEIVMQDNTGIIRGFSSFFDAGDYKRATDKNLVTLVKSYP